MKKNLIIGAAALATLVVVLGIALTRNSATQQLRPPQTTNQAPAKLQKVVINEAVRTVLYLPLYHALEQGYFRDEGLDVQLVTGGTATASFAAMLSGEADFSEADPMYVPISRQKGGETKVVAQVVARIAVWGLAMDPCG
jgi:NitT/TauT family transport system substrate-binding protein